MLKEKIIKLRKNGKTYNEIKEILGCSKSVISYHCSNLEKECNSFIDNVDIEVQKKVINLRLLGKKYKDIQKEINEVTHNDVERICKLNNLCHKDRINDDAIKELRKKYKEIGTIKGTYRETGYSFETIKKYVNDLIEEYGKVIVGKSDSYHVVTWRKRKKIELVNYKGGKCEECGYNKCINALEFHHLDEKEKDFTIGGKSWSFERLKAEVDKCILVCSNCHKEIHYNKNILDGV